MRSLTVGLDVCFLVWPFVYFHRTCVRTAKALARLRRCAGSPEPSLVAYAISTIISWAGSYCFKVWSECKFYVDASLSFQYKNRLYHSKATLSASCSSDSGQILVDELACFHPCSNAPPHQWRHVPNASIGKNSNSWDLNAICTKVVPVNRALSL